MSLRIREIVIRAEVTGSGEDRLALQQDSQDESKGIFEQPGLAARFYEDDHAKENER